jgi:hypothetical protein
LAYQYSSCALCIVPWLELYSGRCLFFSLVTTAPTCPTPLDSNGTLFDVINPVTPMTSYACFARNWIATGTSAKLDFHFRHDNTYWLLDDVSVQSGATEMIVNGGFELGMSNWTRVGNCSGPIATVVVSPAEAMTGSNYLKSACRLFGERISQNFSTIAGNLYVIRFWLASHDCCGSTVRARVMVV